MKSFLLISLLVIAECITAAGPTTAPTTEPAELKLKTGAPDYVVNWFEWAKAKREGKIAETKQQLEEVKLYVEKVRTADIRKSTGKPNGNAGGPRMVFDTTQNKMAALKAAKDRVDDLTDQVANPPAVKDLPMPASSDEFKVGAIFSPRKAQMNCIVDRQHFEAVFPIYVSVTVTTPAPRGESRALTGAGSSWKGEHFKESRTIMIKGIDTSAMTEGGDIQIEKWLVITGVDQSRKIFVAEPFDPWKWIE